MRRNGKFIAIADVHTQDQQREIDKTKIVFGMSLGPADPQADDESFGTRVIPAKKKVGQTFNMRSNVINMSRQRCSLRLKR